MSDETPKSTFRSCAEHDPYGDQGCEKCKSDYLIDKLPNEEEWDGESYLPIPPTNILQYTALPKEEFTKLKQESEALRAELAAAREALKEIEPSLHYYCEGVHNWDCEKAKEALTRINKVLGD